MATTVFDLVAQLTLDTKPYSAALTDSEKKAQSWAGGFKSFSKKAAVAAGKAIAAGMAAAGTATAAFAKTAIDAGKDFDSSMSQVAATMGKTMEEMTSETGTVELAWGKFTGTLRDYAQEMGRNTAFSATQCADALNYMALAGYDTQTSMEMLPNVLNLAAAGNMDLARASDMVTDTQTAFGISIERTSQMVDEMAKAASTGNTSVEQLGEAFLTVGGLAAELNGGMVTLADGTKKPVDGVQELEIALTAMANAGVKGSEAGTHMRNMLLKLSSPTTEGTKQLEALGVQVFDTEGKMRSLSDIFTDLDSSLGKLTQQEKLQAVADLFNARDLASAEALLASIEGEYVQIGDEILSMGSAVEKYGDKIYDSSQGFEIHKSSWNEIGESILNAEGAAKKMADTQLDNLEGDITLFKSALEGAQIAISDELTPTLREFVQYGTDGLTRLTSAFKDGGLDGLVDEFGKVLNEGVDMIGDMLPNILKAVGGVAEGLAGAIPTLATAIVEALPVLADAAINIVLALVNGITDSLPELIPAAIEAILTIVQALITNVPLLLDAAIQLVLGLVNGLIDSLPILLEFAPQIVGQLVAAIGGSAEQLIVAAVAIISALITALIDNFPLIVEQGIALVFNLAKGFLDGMPNVIKAVIKLIGNIKNTWTSIKWSELGSRIIEGIVKGFTNGIDAVKKAAKKIAKAALDSMKNFLGIHSPSKVFELQIGKNMALGVGEGFTEYMPYDEMQEALAFDVAVPQYETTLDVSSFETGNTETTNRRLEQMLADFFPVLLEAVEEQKQITIDGRKIVNYVDEELGKKYIQKGRGN